MTGHKLLLKEAEREGLAEQVHREKEILEVGWRDKAKSKEKKRLEEAKKAAVLLKAIPGSRSYKTQLVKSLANSKATYGWTANCPTEALTAKVDGAALHAAPCS